MASSPEINLISHSINTIGVCNETAYGAVEISEAAAYSLSKHLALLQGSWHLSPGGHFPSEPSLSLCLGR